MKKTKVIIPALGILLLSTAASVTGTVAWFSMNNTVQATGMKVQAKVETGIVIANADHNNYDDVATAKNTNVEKLFPSSTSDLSNWFHANSSNTAYATGADYVDSYTKLSDTANYVISHDFYIKSSSYGDFAVQSLDIQKVEVKVGDNAPTEELSKAIRVGINLEGDSNDYIYAPLRSGDDLTYTVTTAAGTYADTSASRATVNAKASATPVNSTINSVPGNNVNGLLATIYIWFEGEDADCKSANIGATLEELTVSVSFGYTPKSE